MFPSFLSSKQFWNELLIMSARNAVAEKKHTLADPYDRLDTNMATSGRLAGFASLRDLAYMYMHT